MTQSPLAAWHELVRSGDSEALRSLLAEYAVFHSPIVHAARPAGR